MIGISWMGAIGPGVACEPRRGLPNYPVADLSQMNTPGVAAAAPTAEQSGPPAPGPERLSRGTALVGEGAGPSAQGPGRSASGPGSQLRQRGLLPAGSGPVRPRPTPV